LAREKVTIPYLYQKRARGEKITMLTCYDYPTALLEEKAGVDIILVGDSLAMTVLGHDNTLPATMDVMVVHAQAVRRGAPGAFLVGDMPYMSYQVSKEEAIRNAGRFMAEAGCDAVKLEGGRVMEETVRFLVERGIPVCGHLGLLPQSVHQVGGWRVQGREEAEAAQLLADARILDQAGVGLMVLEMTTRTLARSITANISAPTIGIGAGPDCSGQVLVLYDMLGIYGGRVPRFVRNFMPGADSIEAAVAAYVRAVKDGSFPAAEHGFD